MKIYGRGKSRSFRCIWAAEEAGINYEYIEVKFGSEGTNTETYRQLNFQGKVPTMVDDDLVLNESGAIVNYIATKAPAAGLIPIENTKLRAQYDQLAFFVLSDLEQPLWTSGKHRFVIPKEYRVPEVLETTKWEFNKSQKALVNLIGERPTFALGDHFSMADVLIAHTLAWAERFEFELFDGLKEYKDRMHTRQACLDVLAKIGS